MTFPTFARRKCVKLSSIGVFGGLLCLLSSAPAFAGPIMIGPWYEFAFTLAGTDPTGCFPADPAGPACSPSTGTPTTFADAPPWTFVAPAGGATLTVTDAFASGDQFEILDSGVVIGMTSLPVVPDGCGDDPVPCLANPSMSSGVFALPGGAHSLVIVPLLSPFQSGNAYFRVDAAAVPEPATWLLFSAGAAAVMRRRRTRRFADS